MEVVIGLGVLCFSFFYLAFKLDDKHALMKILSLIFGVLVMLVMSSRIVLTQDCAILPTYTHTTYQYGANFSGYHWDYNTSTAPTFTPAEDPAFLFHEWTNTTYARVCFDYPDNTGFSIFKLMNYFIRIMLWYIFGFLLWLIFNTFGNKMLELARRLFTK